PGLVHAVHAGRGACRAARRTHRRPAVRRATRRRGPCRDLGAGRGRARRQLLVERFEREAAAAARRRPRLRLPARSARRRVPPAVAHGARRPAPGLRGRGHGPGLANPRRARTRAGAADRGIRRLGQRPRGDGVRSAAGVVDQARPRAQDRGSAPQPRLRRRGPRGPPARPRSAHDRHPRRRGPARARGVRTVRHRARRHGGTAVPPRGPRRPLPGGGRMKRLRLDGLTALPGQVWGAVRLVPLVRERPFDSLLRLHPQIYEIAPAAVRLNRPTVHQSYIPHGIVAQWAEGGPSVNTVGTRLTDPRRPAAAEVRGKPRAERRTVRRPSGNRLRFLPLHLSMEGYLSLHFGGPSMAWDEWSRLGLDEGPPPQVETAYPGKAVTGLGDALRVFEIHPEQCGMLIFVADALAGAFAVPHPEDYRLLHPTLVEDLYGELIWQYALFHGDVPDFGVRLREDEGHTVADLRAAGTAAVEEWGRFQLGTMAEGLLGADYRFDELYAMGPYRLWRFQPRFEPRREPHIG